MSRALNFDRLARPYRWLEYLTFGHALERCRFHYLAALPEARHALVLGDGDGRFLARLLKANPQIRADVVDISPAMLAVLAERLDPEMRSRITLIQADICRWTPSGVGYDLVVTHFFLDCLFEQELAALVNRIQPRVTPNACWVVSEFARPRGKAGSIIGNLVVSALYFAFRLLTGLRVQSLPNHAAALARAGFVCREKREWRGGLLVSQLWRYLPR